MRKNFFPAILLLSLLACRPVSAAAAQPAAKDSDVLAVVNGAKLTKNEVKDRLWKRYGDATMRELMDELIIKQESAAQKVSADPKEIETRLKRLRSQFPDEAAFTKRLEDSGTNLAELTQEIKGQVLREALLVKAKGLTVADAEIQKFFDDNKERLGAPEAAHVRHILVKTEKEAKDFLTSLRAGADFAALAKQVSLDNATKDNGGDLGFVTKGNLQPEVEKVVFALKTGQISEPVSTPSGYHLIKLDELRPGKPAELKDIRDEIRQGMLGEKLTKEWPGYLKELREKAKIELKIK
jgi:foldase protein PrsA